MLKWVNVADYWNCDKANGPTEENPHDLSLLSSAAVLMAERIRIDVVDGEGNDIAKVLMAGRSPFRPMRYSRCLPAGTLFGRSWAWRLCASPHSLSNPHVGNSFDRQHDYQPFPRVGCGTVSCLWGICCSSRPRRLVGAWPRPRHCNSNCFQRGARQFLGTPTTRLAAATRNGISLQVPLRWQLYANVKVTWRRDIASFVGRIPLPKWSGPGRPAPVDPPMSLDVICPGTFQREHRKRGEALEGQCQGPPSRPRPGVPDRIAGANPDPPHPARPAEAALMRPVAM